MSSFSSALLRRRHHPSLLRPAAAISSAAWEAPFNKSLLRAKDSIKDTPTLSPSHPHILLPNQEIGLVAAAQANFMRVITQSAGAPPENPNPTVSDSRAGRELLCVVRALLKKIMRRILVGDKVLVSHVDWADRRGMIEDAFERSSVILDPPVANVDRLLVLFSMDQPRLDPFMLTRFLVDAESSGIPFMLAINKSDLVDDEMLSFWNQRLHSWGYKPLFCSIGRRSGLAALENILKRQTTVIVGPSGVGKSSLINSLRSVHSISEEEELNYLLEHNGENKWFGEQRVGAVSEKSGQGKHTTPNVSLLPISGGGYLADTPGYYQPSLLKVTKRTLAETFPEIRLMLRASKPVKCSFSGCLHIGEPGCVVKTDWERYPYYFQLVDEIRIREEFQLRTFGTKKESNVRYKVGDMGAIQAEPRLEFMKHRRVSRKRLNQSILDDFDNMEEDDWEDIEESKAQ